MFLVFCSVFSVFNFFLYSVFFMFLDVFSVLTCFEMFLNWLGQPLFEPLSHNAQLSLGWANKHVGNKQ